MGKLLVLLIALSGCSGAGVPAAFEPIGPNAQDQETALEVVWEGAFGMGISSRPTSITWWSTEGCGEDLDATGSTLVGSCALDSEGSKGDIYIRWKGSVSASNWSRALVMWRQYLMTGAMTKPSADDFVLVDAANRDLRDIGL